MSYIRKKGMILRLSQKNLTQAQVLLENKTRFLWMKRNLKEVLDNTMTLDKLLKTLKTLLKTLETLKNSLLQISLNNNNNNNNNMKRNRTRRISNICNKGQRFGFILRRRVKKNTTIKRPSTQQS